MRDILEKLAAGEISVDEAEKLLKLFLIEEVGNMARIDIGREQRRGVPEIILAEGKTPEDVVEIATKLLENSGRAILSRVQKEHIEALERRSKRGSSGTMIIYEKARIVVLHTKDYQTQKTGGKIGILAAGTTDIPVAEEVRVIAEEMGCETIAAYDVGVAGIHRLFPALREFIEKDADVAVAVAGREGALPSVVAGLLDIPIIAVPTSTGYGMGEKGMSALTAMLQACALGIAVVNIDAGVAAGTVAALIANRIAKKAK
ncbi:MAG: nickel pincer cofactor biosynthesis protein LarB [Candidatus Atabeyarchaeum deiterrae]